MTSAQPAGPTRKVDLAQHETRKRCRLCRRTCARAGRGHASCHRPTLDHRGWAARRCRPCARLDAALRLRLDTSRDVGARHGSRRPRDSRVGDRGHRRRRPQRIVGRCARSTSRTPRHPDGVSRPPPSHHHGGLVADPHDRTGSRTPGPAGPRIRTERNMLAPRSRPARTARCARRTAGDDTTDRPLQQRTQHRRERSGALQAARGGASRMVGPGTVDRSRRLLDGRPRRSTARIAPAGLPDTRGCTTCTMW